MEAEGNGISLSVPVKVNKDTTRNVTIFLNIPIAVQAHVMTNWWASIKYVTGFCENVHS